MSIQPSRQPGMPQYLENELTTSAVREVRHAQAPSPSPSVCTMPW